MRFARYADDWCVFITRGSKRYAEQLRDRIGEFLSQHCGVELSMEKTRITTAQCIRKYGRGENISIGNSYVLKRAQDIKMSWKQESPKPYEPGTGCYLDDVDWEAEVRQYESRQRPGRMDFKATTLFRDGYRCRKCGTRVTYETSEADHIKPVNRFASYAQATTLLNLQTLCLACHKEETRAK